MWQNLPAIAHWFTDDAVHQPNPWYVDWHSLYTLGTTKQKSALAHAQLAHTIGLGVKSLLVTYWSSSKNFCCNFQLPNQKLQHTRQQSKASKRLFNAFLNSMFACRVHGEPSFSSQRSESLCRSIMPFITFSLKNALEHLITPARNILASSWTPLSKGTCLIVRVSSLHQHR